MLSSFKRPQWRRIYLQTLTLTYKNLLIFYKAPVATALRALIVPVAVTLILCYLKHISEGTTYSAPSGVASSSRPIPDLSQALAAVSSQRLVFVLNGIGNESLIPVIDAVLREPGMQKFDSRIVDDPDDLFDVCKQSIQGTSDCFAAVLFTSFNETNADYIIAVDEDVAWNEPYNYQTHKSLLTSRLLPLQWALNSRIGNFSGVPSPSEQPWNGYFGPLTGPPPPPVSVYWLSLVEQFAAPIFSFIIIGVSYHLSTFVALERQSSVAELMAAQMITSVPRILSTFLSFLIIYLPSFVICSVLLTQILFTRTSDGLFLILTILAGASLTVSTHFVASFFNKAQLAGLYTSVLAFALGLVTLAATLSSKSSPQALPLALIFPPTAWVTLVGDVARTEYNGFAFPHAPQDLELHMFNGYLYFAFFIVQIILYSLGTFWVEKQLWLVTRPFERIDAESDVAIRCRSLTKTYNSRRRWYWPFKTRGPQILAVNGLDLEVRKGLVTFLLGPNGGGKTTVLKCAAGMTNIDSRSHIGLNEGGLNFGICPQYNVFWDSLTVQEHIRIWRKLKTAAFEDGNTMVDDDVIQECDLADKVDASAKTLSGGQMRKLQLAIAFVGGSTMCCIDEASSGLDPLSRRNIWNIIQKGRSRRTILVTTHFLDEADVLADHIAIIHKGKLICEGPGTTLKAQFGDGYRVSSDSELENDLITWKAASSAAVARKVLELEALNDERSYDVVFPSLEQVFLKVTADSNTAVHEHGGDGVAGEEEPITVIDEKIMAIENENRDNIDLELDVGHSVGIARQILVLFRKRYILLLQRSSWIAYGINLLIPIIIGAALSKFLHHWRPLQTCQTNDLLLRNASASEVSFDHAFEFGSYAVFAPLQRWMSPSLYSNPAAVVGPESAFSGPIQDQLYISSTAFLFESFGSTPNASFLDNQALLTRKEAKDLHAVVATISNSYGQIGFGIFAPSPDAVTLFHSASPDYAGVGLAAFDLITNRISNSTSIALARRTSSTLRLFRHVEPSHDIRDLPIAILIVLALISAVSIAVIYPAYEKINHVRALHYSNGVSPFALWLAYLLFDVQFLVIQALIVWGVLFAGAWDDVWYEPNYILGATILFGIASYLGTYLLSIFVKKAAFAVAVGVHVLLFILYLAAYVINQYLGSPSERQQTYTLLQYGLGLVAPGANLARALFLGMNTFDVLCGKYGNADVSKPFAYELYGGVYANLLVQIAFLIAALSIYEYGSADWLRRNVWQRKVPARLHHIIDTGDAPAAPPPPASVDPAEKTTNAATTRDTSPILRVSRVSKFFGPVFTAQNVSFNVAANEILALLGANGAGKTTVINMIRGELKPDFGDIYLDSTSVLRHPHKAKLHIGVCPQDDAIDNLTVRQTLNFYAAVKGLKSVRGNVDRVMDALDITHYEHITAKNLSGGTRRKLSVAIALLGNPRILLLDEPSTGQDAGAKRILWRALQKISTNRAILLTTHSMEEAEALASTVAILHTKMLATGSLPALRASHGSAFRLRAIRNPESSATEVEDLVREKFHDRVMSYVDSHAQVSFGLPYEKRMFGTIMKGMEELKGEGGTPEDGEEARAGGSSAVAETILKERGGVKAILDYTITGPTLEEVFMSVVREAAGVDGDTV